MQKVAHFLWKPIFRCMTKGQFFSLQHSLHSPFLSVSPTITSALFLYTFHKECAYNVLKNDATVNMEPKSFMGHKR